jgi:uncharacterized protein YydD (DUF2326 family)
MSKLSSKTTEWLKAAEQKYIADMPEITEENRSRVKYMQDGLKAVQEELALRLVEKKSESQPSQSTAQLPTKQEMQEWAKKEEQAQAANYVHIETSQKQPESKIYTTSNNGIKTVEAPEFTIPDELINVKLEDSKGNKQVKTFSKAQVRALARKYFSNVHESWLGKDRKMGVGFKNLLAYVVAWKEFDGALPVLRDVLPDYDRYNKGGESKEASDAFKVAQELYNKIVEILQA